MKGVITIFAHDADGKVLAEDLYSPQGLLLVKAGSTLNKKLIKTINEFRVYRVDVYSNVIRNPVELTYIRNGKEYSLITR